MSAEPKTTAAPDLGEDVATLYRLEAQIGDLEQRRAELRAQITGRLHVGQRWTNDQGIGVLLGQPVFKFNPVRALVVLAGTDWLTTILKPTPDRELALRYLPERLYRACCTESGPVLRRVSGRP
jgi:hypothetical protein